MVINRKPKKPKHKKVEKLPKQKVWKSVVIDNPKLRNRITNRYVFDILKELSREENRLVIYYIKLVRNKDGKPVDICNTQKLVKRLSKDKLVKIKKDNKTRSRHLFITDEGRKCLNLLLQQPYLKE